MAAIFSTQLDPISSPEAPRTARPNHLRVLEGGRGPASMARVYRRRRAVALLGAALVVVVVIVAGAIAFAFTDPGPTTPAPAAMSVGSGPVLVVQSGDTLSSIARRLQPTGDTTALVDRLAAAHGPGPLLAGDRLPLRGVGVPS